MRPRSLFTDALLLVLLGVVLALTLLRSSPRSYQANVSAEATGLYPSEQFSDRPGSYQWTTGDATLDLPNPGGPLVLTLDLAGGPQRTVSAELAAPEGQFGFAVTPELRRYRVLLPASAAPRISVALNTPTFVEAGGERTLGVVLRATRIRGGGVVGTTLLLLLTTLAGVYTLARLLAYTRRVAAGITLVGGVAAALWAAQSWATAPLLPLALPGVLALALAAPATLQLAQRYAPWLAGQRIALLAIAVVSLVLGLRYFSFIDRYAVNLLFFDEWDFMNPLFRGQGPLDMFFYQHGPHRQGLGGLILMVIAPLSAWNSRVVAFVVGSCVLLAMLAALALKRRLTGRWQASDIAIPLIYLSIGQYESLTVAPNPAPSALPALLVVLVPLVWLLRRGWQRYTALAVLTFCVIFTGYSLLLGLLIPALLVVELVGTATKSNVDAVSRFHRWSFSPGPALALLACAGSWALFSINYQITTASSCRLFAYERPAEYPLFVAFMFSHFVGFEYARGPIVVGSVAAVALVTCTGFALLAGLRLVWNGALRYNSPIATAQAQDAQTALNRTIFLLIGFSLLYALNASFARICMGITGGEASRYLLLMTPAFLGLYLALQRIERRWLRHVATTLLIVLLLPIALPIRGNNEADARGFADLKRRWSACYLAEHSIERCTKQAGAIYPGEAALQVKLDFLEAHRLNLFAESR